MQLTLWNRHRLAVHPVIPRVTSRRRLAPNLEALQNTKLAVTLRGTATLDTVLAFPVPRLWKLPTVAEDCADAAPMVQWYKSKQE